MARTELREAHIEQTETLEEEVAMLRNQFTTLKEKDRIHISEIERYFVRLCLLDPHGDWHSRLRRENADLQSENEEQREEGLKREREIR